MSLQIRVTLSASYQRAVTLINTAAAAALIAEPRTNFTRIRYRYPDGTDGVAAGIITGVRNPALSGYAFKLDAPDMVENRVSEKEVYSESTTDMYLKSTNNGDHLIIELDD